MMILLLVVGLGLAISFVCSLLEAVLLSVSHAYVAELEERGDPAGPLLSRMQTNAAGPLTAIITLNTIAIVVSAVVVGAIAHEVHGMLLIGAFAVGLTLAVLLVAEILPKTLGAAYWQALARPTAHTLRPLVWVMTPVIVPLTLLTRLVGPRGQRAPRVSRAELEVLAEIGRREGTFDQAEWQVVSNVINLDQIDVGEIMTPRTSVVALPLDATVDEAKERMLDEGHLRLPVYERSLDHVVGVLLARDLWRADREGVREIRQLVRPPVFVPQTKPVEELIREMRHQRVRMAIVLDEFGGTAGIVTLEDLIEQIVGEIQDEHEQELLPFEEVMEGEVRIRGDVPLWEVNERFDLSLPEHDFDTLGGYVFGQLGRIAEEGDEVQSAGGSFRVVAMDGRRIERVAFVPAPPTEAGSEG
jgi:putative hemolysin